MFKIQEIKVKYSLIFTYQANQNSDLSPKLRFYRTEHPQHAIKKQHTYIYQFQSIYIPIKICIRWQVPCIITYLSTATWAMMHGFRHTYPSLIFTYQANQNSDLSPKLRFYRTEHPQHAIKNTAYVHLFNFIQSIFQTKYVSTANTHASLPTHQLAAEQWCHVFRHTYLSLSRS